MMKLMFARWVTWFNRFNYPQKFTIISLLFLLPVLAFLPIFGEQVTRIRQYGYYELYGTYYLRPLQDLLVHVQEYRRTEEALRHNEANEAELAQVAEKINQDFVTLENYHNQYAEALNLDTQLADLQTQWQATRDETRELSLPELNVAYRQLETGVQNLILYIGDTSFLILDPELKTYYLMDVLLLQMPQKQLLLDQIRGIVSKATRDGFMTINDRTLLLYLTNQLQSELLDMEASIDKTEHVDDMEPLIQDYSLATTSLLYYVVIYNQAILPETVNLTQFNELADEVQRTQTVLYDHLSVDLENGIKDRINRYSLQTYIPGGIALLSLLIGFWFGFSVMRTISRPLTELAQATQSLAEGNLTARVNVRTEDEVGKGGQAFNNMGQALQTSQERLVERNRAIAISAEISRRLSTILDPDQLILEVVEQVKSAYNYYHAHIYLLDERQQILRMVGGTGDVGKALLAQGHTMVMGRGIVGRAAQSRRGILVPDTSQERGWVANPLLPDTRAEIAVPILLRDQVIGVLDVQDDVTNDVFEEDVELLQGIASQVAVALQNARQYREVQRLFLGGQTLAAATDYQNMLQAVMTFGTDQADQGALLIFNHSDIGELVSVEYAAAWSRHPDQPQPEQVGTVYTSERVPFLTALLSDRPLLIADVNQYQASAGLFGAEFAQLLTGFGMQALASLPLILGPQRLGAVLLGYAQPHVFSEDELQPAQTLVGQIAILLQNQRLLAETRSALNQLDIINRRLTREAWQEFAHLTGGITVEDGVPGVRLEANGSGPVADELAVPVQVRGAEIGQMTVQQLGTNAPFSADDHDLMQEVANEVAIALENMRLVEQTQRNAAALEESRNLLNSIIENLPVLLFVKDAKELRYVTWNKAGEELLGISADQVLGKNAYDQFTQEEADRFTEQDRQILGGTNYLDIAEETVMTPRGLRTLHTRKTPVYSADGAPQYLIGLSEDITDRKQAEQALRDLETLYRRTIAAADAVPYSRSYADESYTFVGEGIERLTGYPVEQFTARLFDAIVLETNIHEETGADHDEAVQLVRAGKVSRWRANYRIRTRDGSERWLADTSIEVLGPDGVSTGSVGILTDITERKRTEQALNRQLLETESLNTLGFILTTQNDLDEMLAQVGQHICTTFAVDTGSVILYDARAEATHVPFALEAGVRLHDAPLPPENDLLAEIIKSHQPLLISEQNEASLRKSGFKNLPSPLPACWLGAPVLVNEQLIGIITIQHAEQSSWLKESDTRFLTTIINNLSTAIQNIRLFAQTQNTLAELEALTRRLTHEGWQSYLTETTQERLAYLYEGDRLISVEQDGQQNGSVLPIKIEQSFVQPVTIHGEEIGRLVAEDVDLEVEEFQAIIEAVSQGLSTHLDNLRLNEQTERALAEARQRTIELNTLNELGRALATATHVDEIVQHVHTYLPELVPANDFYFALNHPDTNEVEIQVFINGESVSHFRREFGNGITEHILRTRESVVISGNLASVAQAKGFQVIGRETSAFVGVPMVAGQNVVGVLAMQSEDNPHQFTPAHVELLSSVANQVAISLNNIYLLVQTQERANELALINRVVSAVSASLDIRQSLQVVANELSRAIQVEQTGIALLSEDRQSLTVVAETFDPGRSASAIGFVIPVVGNLSTEEVMRTRKPLIITDPMTSPLTASFHDGLRMRQVQNLTIFPILIGNEVIGTVGIDILEPGRVLSQQQVYLAETIIYQAAIAIENVRLFEQTESALQEVRTLFEISVKLNAARTLAEMLEALMQTARDAGAQMARLFTLELNEAGEPEWGVIAAAWSHAHEPTPVGTRFPWSKFAPSHFWAENPDTVLFVTDVAHDSLLDENARQFYLQANEKAGIWLPLTSQRRWLGLALITWNQHRTFTLGEQRLYESLRTQASTIMENRLLYEQSQARTAELAVINQVAETVARELEAQRVMEIVYQKVQRIMIADAFLIGLYHTETDQITYPILYDQGERHAPAPASRNAQSHAFQVIDSAQPLLINLTPEQQAQSLSERPTVGQAQYPASFIHVPMFTGTQVTGVMSVQSYEPDAYDEGDVALLTGIANYVSLSLENARLFTQTQTRAAELTTINEMNQIASSQLTLSGLIYAVGQQLEKTFQSSGIYLALYDKEHSQITFPYFMETEDGERKLVNIPPRHLDDPGVTGRIIKTGEPILVTQDTQTTMLQLGASTTASGAGDVDAYLGVPMIVGDEVIGVIAVQNDAGLRLFTEVDQRLLMTLAATIGVAIRNAQQFEAARRRAQRERLLNEITQKIQGTHSMEGALQTAVKELGQALKAKYARVEIAAATDSPGNGKNGV